MNRKQKQVIVAGIILGVLVGLLPPWRFVVHSPAGMLGARNLGRSFSAPNYLDYYGHVEGDEFYRTQPAWIETSIDTQTLVVEWVTLLIVIGGVFLLLKSPPAKRENDT